MHAGRMNIPPFLPDDVLVLIFRHLGPPYAPVLRLVSVAWRNASDYTLRQPRLFTARPGVLDIPLVHVLCLINSTRMVSSLLATYPAHILNMLIQPTHVPYRPRRTPQQLRRRCIDYVVCGICKRPNCNCNCGVFYDYGRYICLNPHHGTPRLHAIKKHKVLRPLKQHPRRWKHCPH